MSLIPLDLSLSPPAESLHIVKKIIGREGQPEIQEIIELLELDPVTTTHALRQVNSPIYALRQSVGTLDRAATMLGFDAVSNTIFVETFIPKAEVFSGEMARLAYAYLVRTSVAAAAIAHSLAHTFEMELAGAVQTAALLHQLGRMSLLSAEPEKYLSLWKKGRSPDGQPIALPPGIGREIAHFRTDYTRHGAGLAEEWRLPEHISRSARYHTDPERAEHADDGVVRLVAVSQFAARTLFESEDDLDRDQGRERVEHVVKQLAAGMNVSRSELETMLKDAKPSAHRRATGIELFAS